MVEENKKEKKKIMFYLILFVLIVFHADIIRSADPKDRISVEEAALIIMGIKANYSQLAHIKTRTILAIIEIESNFKINAVSSKNAQGLMQLLPSVYRWILKQNNLFVSQEDVYNSESNILAGMLLLQWLLDQLNGNLMQALTAYNVGLSNFKSGMRNESYLHKWVIAEKKYKILGY